MGDCLKLDRKTALSLLLLPLPTVSKHNSCPRPVGVRLRIERVYGAMPFLTDEEQAKARAWLELAEAEQRQYKGRITWQDDQARD